MTAHPHHLLADYVDGDLAPEGRAAVEGHLDGCPTCRQEVLQARVARSALASLREVDPPPGIPLAVRRLGRPDRSPRLAWRAAGIAAAAAAVLAGGVVVLVGLDEDAREAAAPGLERQGQEATAGSPSPAAPKAAEDAGGGAPALAAAVPVPSYEESDRDYGTDDLFQLADGFQRRARTALDSGLAPTAQAFYRTFDLSTFAPEVRTAIRCVIEDAPPQELAVPLTVEAASFDGEPAYIASFLQGPSPAQPYDRILIWAVDRETCTLRSFATRRL